MIQQRQRLGGMLNYLLLPLCRRSDNVAVDEPDAQPIFSHSAYLSALKEIPESWIEAEIVLVPAS